MRSLISSFLFGLISTTFMTTVFSDSSFAQVSALPSPAERRICEHNGRYAVFAQHPLYWGAWGFSETPPPQGGADDTLNNQLSHEHIFFCENGRVVNNIGYGNENGGSRFSYSQIPGDYVPITNNERSFYHPDIINEIIGIMPNSCELQPDGNYHGVLNNCQDFTARIREQYLQRISDQSEDFSPFVISFYCDGREFPDANNGQYVCNAPLEPSSIPVTVIFIDEDGDASDWVLDDGWRQGSIASWDGTIQTSIYSWCTYDNCYDNLTPTVLVITDATGLQSHPVTIPVLWMGGSRTRR